MAAVTRPGTTTPAPAPTVPTAPTQPQPTSGGMPVLQPGGGGSYSEGNAFLAVEYLRNLRTELNAGNITTAQFTEMSRPVAEFIFSEQLRLGGSGSAAANVGNQLRTTFEQAGTGYKQDATGDPKTGTILDLPAEYAQETRQDALPDNIDPTLRDRLVNEIPGDIPVESDRYAIEREGVRQNQQDLDLNADLAKQYQDFISSQRVDQNNFFDATKQGYDTLNSSLAEQRQSNLGQLGGVLTDRQMDLFNRAVPNLAEQANTKGILQSTGFGDSLAREYANLTRDTQSQLAEQGIRYLDSGIADQQGAFKDVQQLRNQGFDTLAGYGYDSLRQGMANQQKSQDVLQGYQDSGLQREFSLKDYEKQKQDTIQYGKEFAPVQSGKTNGEKAYQGANATANVVGAVKGKK